MRKHILILRLINTQIMYMQPLNMTESTGGRMEPNPSERDMRDVRLVINR